MKDFIVETTAVIAEFQSIEMTKQQVFHIVGALAFSIAEETTFDYEIVDWGLYNFPEEIVDLCNRLSEPQKIAVIEVLSKRGVSLA